ncbi:MAG: hypothetical protein H7Y09_07850 [Chitinophagaceae bacterium]|nr:hypothetical protein [Anaerolineae bacterium]
MAYKTWWAVENRVVHQTCSGELTLEELSRANQDVVEAIHAGTPLVHVVIDLTEVTRFPTNLKEIAGVFKRDNATTERTGWLCVIGVNVIIRFFASIISQLWNKARFRMFATVDEAYAFLAQSDLSIDMSNIKRQPQTNEAASNPNQ